MGTGKGREENGLAIPSIETNHRGLSAGPRDPGIPSAVTTWRPQTGLRQMNQVGVRKISPQKKFSLV